MSNPLETTLIEVMITNQEYNDLIQKCKKYDLKCKQYQFIIEKLKKYEAQNKNYQNQLKYLSIKLINLSKLLLNYQNELTETKIKYQLKQPTQACLIQQISRIKLQIQQRDLLIIQKDLENQSITNKFENLLVQIQSQKKKYQKKLLKQKQQLESVRKKSYQEITLYKNQNQRLHIQIIDNHRQLTTKSSTIDFKKDFKLQKYKSQNAKLKLVVKELEKKIGQKDQEINNLISENYNLNQNYNKALIELNILEKKNFQQ